MKKRLVADMPLNGSIVFYHPEFDVENKIYERINYLNVTFNPDEFFRAGYEFDKNEENLVNFSLAPNMPLSLFQSQNIHFYKIKNFSVPLII